MNTPDGYWSLELPTRRTSTYNLAERSTFVYVCETCGVVVGSTTRHSAWHIDPRPPEPDSPASDERPS